jgi:hypothetical protein
LSERFFTSFDVIDRAAYDVPPSATNSASVAMTLA